MVGGEASKIFHSGKRQIGDVVLQVKDLFLHGPAEEPLLKSISFDVRRGEVLGIYGLLGAGRTETLESIMGLHREARGKIFLENELLGEPDIKSRIRKGIALVPEDRQREGIVQTMSVSHNLTLPGLWRIVKKKIHISGSDESSCVNETITSMSIKTSNPADSIMSLSGGNQQKVVFGKSLLIQPKVLLLDEPTRGIDVGAKGEIFNIMNDLAQKGLAIIMVTSELKELLAICDRVIVLSKGRITGNFGKEDISEENIVNASTIGHMTTAQRVGGKNK
jgi:ABC-type sugar transport system ATPase subunit